MPLPTTIEPRKAVCVFRYPMAIQVTPNVSATPAATQRPTETTDRTSRKNRITAMNIGTVPANPTRSLPADSSSRWRSATARSSSSSARASRTPRLEPTGRTTSVREDRSGWTRKPSTLEENRSAICSRGSGRCGSKSCTRRDGGAAAAVAAGASSSSESSTTSGFAAAVRLRISARRPSLAAVSSSTVANSGQCSVYQRWISPTSNSTERTRWDPIARKSRASTGASRCARPSPSGPSSDSMLTSTLPSPPTRRDSSWICATEGRSLGRSSSKLERISSRVASAVAPAVSTAAAASTRQGWRTAARVKPSSIARGATFVLVMAVL